MCAHDWALISRPALGAENRDRDRAQRECKEGRPKFRSWQTPACAVRLPSPTRYRPRPRRSRRAGAAASKQRPISPSGRAIPGGDWHAFCTKLWCALQLRKAGHARLAQVPHPARVAVVAFCNRALRAAKRAPCPWRRARRPRRRRASRGLGWALRRFWVARGRAQGRWIHGFGQR